MEEGGGVLNWRTDGTRGGWGTDSPQRLGLGGVGREPPTHQAVRLEGAALGQHGQQRLLAEKQLTDNAIAAPEAAATPGPQS